MKAFIIFGLLFIVNCKAAGIDNDDFDFSGDHSGDHEDKRIVFAVTKDETFVRKLGETVLLPCTFSGNHTYVQVWERNDTILMMRHNPPDNMELLPNGTLKITNLTAEDAALYVCSAVIVTVDDEDEKNPKITHILQIEVPPQSEIIDSHSEEPSGCSSLTSALSVITVASAILFLKPQIMCF